MDLQASPFPRVLCFVSQEHRRDQDHNNVDFLKIRKFLRLLDYLKKILVRWKAFKNLTFENSVTTFFKSELLTFSFLFLLLFRIHLF